MTQTLFPTAALPSSSPASNSTFTPEVIRLENGLTLLHHELPTAVVTVDLWLAAGSVVEPPGSAGVAHFLEHLIFKGTERLAPGDFDLLVEAGGGLTNAGTSYDYVHYYFCSVVDQLPQLMPALAELLFQAAIPDGEFERERQVVLEEIRQYEDDPDGVGMAALWAEIYGKHPYGRPILGEPEQLLAQSPESMRLFHRKHYRPEQMTLVMTGGLGRDQALSLAQQYFKPQPVQPEFASTAANLLQPQSLPLGSSVDLSLSTVPGSTVPGMPIAAISSPSGQQYFDVPRSSQGQGIIRHSLTLPQLEQPRLMMAWPGPGLERPDVGAGLDLLSVLLTSGRLGRLIQDLREQRRWVNDIDSGYAQQRQSGLFTLTVWLEAEYLEPVEAVIQEHLQCLASEPVSASELARARRLLSNDFAFSLETAEQWADLLGYNQIMDQLPLALAYPHQLAQWTAVQLQQLAQQYLSPKDYTAMVLYPQPRENQAESLVISG